MLEPQQKQPEKQELDLPHFHDDDEIDDSNQHRQRSRRRGWIIGIAIVLLLIILVPATLYIIRSMRPPRVVYQYRQTTSGNLSLVVNATGPVQGTIYNADFATSGKISEIDVKVGQYVKAGTVLAKIDATALQDALNQAQATLQQQKDF